MIIDYYFQENTEEQGENHYTYCDNDHKSYDNLSNLQKSFLSFCMHNTPQKDSVHYVSSIWNLCSLPSQSMQYNFPDIDNANIVTFHAVTVDWPEMVIHCHACIWNMEEWGENH